MKILYVLALLSSLLFSMDAQKQIILGSYSIEKNGLTAVETTKKQISNDQKLQELMDKYSLRTISTVISGYTVVSINHFNSYSDLLASLKAFKTYYDDAFVLNYPTKGIKDIQDLADIEAKAKEETEAKLLEEEAQEAQRLLEEKRIAEENVRIALEEAALKAAQEVQAAEIEEPNVIETTQSINDIVEEKEEGLGDDVYYLLGALALLLLLIGGFMIFKSTTKDS